MLRFLLVLRPPLMVVVVSSPSSSSDLGLIWNTVLRLAVISSIPNCWASHKTVSSASVVSRDVGGVVLDAQTVGLSSALEFFIMEVPVVADVLDLIGQVVKMRHFVEHGRCHLADGPVDVLGADVDFPIRLIAGLLDFIYAAPAIGSAPAVRRYGDGRACKLVIIEVMVEKVEHGLGFGYDFRYAHH